MTTCPKCRRASGDDWKQCGGACPMPGSPHYLAEPSVMRDAIRLPGGGLAWPRVLTDAEVADLAAWGLMTGVTQTMVDPLGTPRSGRRGPPP